MKKSGFSKEDDFQAHKDKDWRTVHDIWPNIKGVVGPPGKKGSIGLLGNTGPQGPTGDAGPQGATGPAGPTGPGGVTGPQGEIGEAGPTGPTGPGGVTGPQGEIGESGPTGVQGPAGVTGAQGEIGESGVQGPTGPEGVTGPQGEIGESGPTGVQGPAGVTGAQGEIGESGAQGPTGPEGVTGPQGSIGESGPTGPSGPAGVTGPQGVIGPSGPTGAVGPTGVQGAQGTVGESGVGASILGPDCKLYLPMIEGSGATVYDKSGEGNDGTLYPTPVPISVCDATTDWTGEDLSIDTDDKKEGTGSLKDTIAAPGIGSYITTYNPAGTWDWSAKKHILFWLKSDRASTAFGARLCYIFDTLGNWRRWQLTFSAGEWTAQKLLLSTGYSESGTPPDLALIDSITVHFVTVDTTPFYKKIDDLRIDDRPQWATSAVSGQCLDFDGEDDYVNCGNDASLNFTTQDFTIGMWIKPGSVTGLEMLFCRGYYHIDGYYFFRNADILNFSTHQSGAHQESRTGSVLTIGSWAYISVVREGASVKIYVNGIDKTTIFGDHINPVTSTRTAKIGIWDDLDYPWDGLIDEVRIYNRALTEGEIALAYKQIYLTGAQGEQGPTGVTGVTGEQGITGPQGEQGASGATGVQGPQGITGPQGEQGEQGITGPQGPQGITGVQGDQGATGVSGVQGPQGITGPQGEQGTQGITGPQGPQGVTGVQGEQGTQGVTGVQGVQGITGPQGEQGIQGITGVTGEEGPAGPTGIQGEPGEFTVFLKAYRNASQSIPNITTTKILFNAEDYDIGNNFDADGVDSNFLTPFAGRYSITSAILLADVGDGKILSLYVFVGGVARARVTITTGAVATQSVSITTDLNLSLNDIVDIRLYHDHGAALDTGASALSIYVCIHNWD